MRDTRESRLLLVLLVAIAFALITVDIKGGEESPLNGARQVAARVFGPAQHGVAQVVDPVANALAAVRDSGSRHDRLSALERENAELKQRLGSSEIDRNRSAELDKLLKTAAVGRYRIKAAQVIAIGAAQGFSWTVTIDAGSVDGLSRDMTVLNGDGLVGRVTTVGPSTATVLLANDPDFTVGTRLEKSMELGFATGQGDRPLRVQLLNGKAEVKSGDRLVTFGSQANKPFVPGVPVGTVVRVDPPSGGLTRSVQVEPFVGFTRLDIVGVVVEGPRENPRDAVLPPEPSASEAGSGGREREQDSGGGPEGQGTPGRNAEGQGARREDTRGYAQDEGYGFDQQGAAEDPYQPAPGATEEAGDPGAVPPQDGTASTPAARSS